MWQTLEENRKCSCCGEVNRLHSVKESECFDLVFIWKVTLLGVVVLNADHWGASSRAWCLRMWRRSLIPAWERCDRPPCGGHRAESGSQDASAVVLSVWLVWRQFVQVALFVLIHSLWTLCLRRGLRPPDHRGSPRRRQESLPDLSAHPGQHGRSGYPDSEF